MSGMMAMLSLDGRPLPVDRGPAMLAAVAHRGDGEPRLWTGQASIAGIVLGQAHRPTTPEAERETLPAASRDGRFWLVWDGRIDNREELARLLDLAPSDARQWTDADYVLASYERWGERCVERLLGDWAIVVWDGVARRLFCARDPLGWRPVYYTQHDGMLALGSEPLQLFAGGPPPSPNYEYVLRFLAHAYRESRETEYAGVRMLLGGEQLVADASGVTVGAYWQRPRIVPRRYRRPEEYVEEFVATFGQATAARLRTNRKLGVFLSGGLDSSYVAAVAAQQGGDLTAISSYAPGSGWDERDYQKLVVERTGIAYRPVAIGDCWALNPRYLPPEAFDSIDHPPQSTLMVRLGEAAEAEGVGVVLGGEGGDEWMVGAPTFVADAIAHGRFREAVQLARITAPGRPLSRVLLRHATFGLVPSPLVRALQRARGHAPAPTERAAIIDGAERWRPARPPIGMLAWSSRAVRRREWEWLQQLALTHAIWRDRRAFQPHGVDLRAPFNDLRVVELMASTPDWVKRFRGRTKDVLREAEYEVLPRAIPDRVGKAPFDDLFLRGVQTLERERVASALDAATALPGVRAEAARSEVARYLDTSHIWTRPAWRLIAVGLWLQLQDALRSARSDSNVEISKAG